MKTIIIRHKKENLKKCSLRGLEKDENILFIKYPYEQILDLSNYVILTIDADIILSKKDVGKGILLIDSTWK